jgi:DNA-directed RNA polymerase subunit RPC12/RpoP
MSKEKYRVFRCVNCGNLIQTSATLKEVKDSEVRCPDPTAPGGYWYCSYEQLFSEKEFKRKQIREASKRADEIIDKMAKEGKRK